jgi:tRNA(fMet)-specific endonuclease VapC
VSYLLDANVCIALMRNPESDEMGNYRRAISERRSVAISTIVLFELEYGLAKSLQTRQNRIRLDTFMSQPFMILPLTVSDVGAAATIRANLARRKQPIGPYDTLIAGQALARGLTLVTANVREFARVDGLKWVDWAKAR